MAIRLVLGVTGKRDRIGGGGLLKMGIDEEILLGRIILPTKYWPEMAGGGIHDPKLFKCSITPALMHTLLHWLLLLPEYGTKAFFSPKPEWNRYTSRKIYKNHSKSSIEMDGIKLDEINSSTIFRKVASTWVTVSNSQIQISAISKILRFCWSTKDRRWKNLDK